MDEQQARPHHARTVRRKRRANVEGGRDATQRSHRVTVSPEEEAGLQLRAQRQNVSVPRLLVESALASDVPVETVTEKRENLTRLFELSRTLGNLGNNVNQIVHHGHLNEGLTDDEMDSLTEYLSECRQVWEQVEALIARSGLS